MKILIMFIFMMISVGFYLLIERKVLGYINFRKGPNKIIFLGLMQFIMDSLKLMFKENLNLILFNKLIVMILMSFLFMMSFFMWMFVPFSLNLINMKLMMMLFLMIMLNKIFIFINLIWILNSIYSLISLIRLIVQSYSFEILILIIFFFFFFYLKNINLIFLNKFFSKSLILMFSLMILYFWIISIMVELNRVPFDYFEGESELVSGFNIEFSSYFFMLLFLIEYLDMILMSFYSTILFLNLDLFNLYMYIYMMIIMLIFLFIRGFIIRYRIDKMFKILWKLMFPLMMNYLVFFSFMMVFY